MINSKQVLIDVIDKLALKKDYWDINEAYDSQAFKFLIKDQSSFSDIYK